MEAIRTTQNIHSRPRPVLMTPVRRCGSHALRLRLNFNPEFHAPYPLHIVDFMPLVELYGDLANDETYFQLIIDVVGMQTASMVKWAGVVFDPVAIFDAAKDRPRSVHSIIWEMLFQAARGRDASVVMDKSLDSVHYAAELINLFDDMLFLNVVRDPRAQVSSMNRAIIHDFDTLLNTLIWVQAHDAARRLAKTYPDRVLTIRFEDFLANQEGVLRKVCTFFGIGFFTEMLDVARSDEAQQISVLSALWESNSSAPIPANIDKFKQQLSMEEIEIIETLAGDHMQHYGYETMTSGSAKVNRRVIEAARERSQQRKPQAWNDLKVKDSRDYQLRMFRADYINMVKCRLLRKQESCPLTPLASPRSEPARAKSTHAARA